ncbi:MAG TPA: HTTM domain-containing protein [Kofleriaceae bacterium]
MKRIGDWWFAPAPAQRLAAIRILVGTFAFLWLTTRLPEFVQVAKLSSQNWGPTGVTRLIGPLSPGAVFGLGAATSVLLAAFVLGIAYRVVAPLAAVGLMLSLTHRNSWGMIFHTDNLLVVHMCVLAIAPAGDAFALWKKPDRAPVTGYGWWLKLLLAVTVVTYILAGIAKLRLAGVAWLDGEQLRNQIAVDNLRKALLGDSIAPLATPFLDHPSGFTLFSVMTIILECGAFMALISQRVGRVWALLAWGFHVGVVALMNIWFPYPLLGLAYLPLFPMERPVGWLIGRAKSALERVLGRAGNVPSPETVRSPDE